jgi:tetratricopeptide (TPR) repeat protein
MRGLEYMSQPEKINPMPISPAAATHAVAIELLKAGKVEESIPRFHEALALEPDMAPAWANLGIALRKIGKFEASAICGTRAIALAQQNPFFLANYGNCLVDLDRFDEAYKAYQESIRLMPDDFTLRYNYGLALRDGMRLQEASVLLKDILKDHPDNFELRWDAALTQLQMGDFKNGWQAFEARFKRPVMDRERVYKTAPRWRGEDIKGKTLLVYEEQGFGDTILCSRYIPLIQARGGTIILECKPALHKLFSAIPGIKRLAEPGQVAEGFDYHVPMMSLPGIFGTDLSSIPPPVSLYTSPALPPRVSQTLALGKGRLKVGIIWSGNVAFFNNRKRAVDVTRFLPLATIPGVQLYSLQKGPRENDLAACGGEGLIPLIGPALNDFSETAAALKQLDLVIMTDSSVAHLAGSLGVPVWNLLSHSPYWLYLTDREDSPWYPSMRLFRQPTAGDWESVFERVEGELGKIAAKAK